MATPHRAIFPIGMMLLAGALASCAQMPPVTSTPPVAAPQPAPVPRGNISPSTDGQLPQPASPPVAIAKAVAPSLPLGQVQAFIVQGDVKIMDENGKVSPLTKGRIFTEHNTILVGENGMALLVFSNGAVLRLLHNAQLEISRFRQAPFDQQAEGSFLRLNHDPSQSDTQLYLGRGTAQGKMQQLNTEAGSAFVINTPVGPAEIHGYFSLTVVRDATGRFTASIVNSLVGGLSFVPKTGATAGEQTNGMQVVQDQNLRNSNNASVDVPAGAQLQIAITLDALGNISGFTASGAGLMRTTSQNAINEIAAEVNRAQTEGSLQPPPPEAPPPAQPSSASLVIEPVGAQQLFDVPRPTLHDPVVPLEDTDWIKRSIEQQRNLFR